MSEDPSDVETSSHDGHAHVKAAWLRQHVSKGSARIATSSTTFNAITSSSLCEMQQLGMTWVFLLSLQIAKH